TAPHRSTLTWDFVGSRWAGATSAVGRRGGARAPAWTAVGPGGGRVPGQVGRGVGGGPGRRGALGKPSVGPPAFGHSGCRPPTLRRPKAPGATTTVPRTGEDASTPRAAGTAHPPRPHADLGKPIVGPAAFGTGDAGPRRRGCPEVPV